MSILDTEYSKSDIKQFIRLVLTNYAETKKPNLRVCEKDSWIYACYHLDKDTAGFGFHYYVNDSPDATLIESLLYKKFEGIKFEFAHFPEKN